MKKWIKRILIVFFCIVALPIVAFFGLAVFLAVKPDIPMFDDSSLALPPMPDAACEQNMNCVISRAFPTAERMGISLATADTNKWFDQIIDQRNPDPEEIATINKTYAPQMEIVDHAVTLPFFIAPQDPMAISPIPQVDAESSRDLFLYRNFARGRIILAWADLRRGRVPEALGKLRSVARLAGGLQNNYDSLIVCLRGTVVDRILYKEIDAMLDSKQATPQFARGVAAILAENPLSPQGFARAFRYIYGNVKAISRNLESFFPQSAAPVIRAWNRLALKGIKKNYSLQLIYEHHKRIEQSLLSDYSVQKRYLDDLEKAAAAQQGVIGTIRLNISGRGIPQLLILREAPQFLQSVDLFRQIQTLHAELLAKAAVVAYRAEKGAPPQSLDDVVAAGYLKSVPRDPFDGKPLRYIPAEGKIYSVGANMKDDHGAFAGQATELETPTFMKERDIVLQVR